MSLQIRAPGALASKAMNNSLLAGGILPASTWTPSLAGDFPEWWLRVAHMPGPLKLTDMDGTGHLLTGQAPGLKYRLETPLDRLALVPNVAAALFFPPCPMCRSGNPMAPETSQTLSDQAAVLPPLQVSRPST